MKIDNMQEEGKAEITEERKAEMWRMQVTGMLPDIKDTKKLKEIYYFCLVKYNNEKKQTGKGD